jgi:hypothetical protein
MKGMQKRYKYGILNVKIYVKEQDFPVEVAIPSSDLMEFVDIFEAAIASQVSITLFEISKRAWTLVDYEIYGFADYRDAEVDYGDKVYLFSRTHTQD